jgi:hypothetical protein
MLDDVIFTYGDVALRRRAAPQLVAEAPVAAHRANLIDDLKKVRRRHTSADQWQGNE